MKMRLHATTTSPFVRKVLVVAHETGLISRIELMPTNPHADECLRLDNPLCKIPTLILDGGDVLFDSPVICEYLDSLHSQAKLFPPAGPARWHALQMQALGDGILDATLSRRMEIMRAKNEQSPEWIERWKLAASTSMDWLDARMHQLDGAVTIGHVAIGCALGYFGVRFPDDPWQAGRFNLARWYEQFAQRPSMRASSYEELSKLPATQIKSGGPIAKS